MSSGADVPVKEHTGRSEKVFFYVVLPSSGCHSVYIPRMHILTTWMPGLSEELVFHLLSLC